MLDLLRIWNRYYERGSREKFLTIREVTALTPNHLEKVNQLTNIRCIKLCLVVHNYSSYKCATCNKMSINADSVVSVRLYWQ